MFSSYCAEYYPQCELYIPALNFNPQHAIEQLELIIGLEGDIALLVGSSLGGYYATYLAEKYNLKAALINPAVSPWRNLSETFLGRHVNSYTNESYELTTKHVDYLSTLDLDVLQYPENFFLLLQTGDEVLDYQLAVDYYRDSKKIVQAGGDHSFVNFENVLPKILQFAKLLSFN